MRAFYYENNTTQTTFKGKGTDIVGQLDLEPGEYAIWAKLLVHIKLTEGVSSFSGGAAILVFGEGADHAAVSLKPQSGEHSDIVNLMTVGKSDRARRARLYFKNTSVLPIYITYVRITALQVEIAEQKMIGDDSEVTPRDPDDVWREVIFDLRHLDDTIRSIPDEDQP